LDLLWTDFLNSEWHDWRGSGRSEDRLDKPAWIAAFLTERRLTAPVPPQPGDLAALKEFRAVLRRMAEALAFGGALDPGDMESLNRRLAEGPVTRRLLGAVSGLQVDLIPTRHDWSGVMAEIAAAFAHSLVEGEGGRVRVCENPDCLWVFYDETRNRTKRFCDEKACGNLMKVRRFRAKRRS
jgi:predicted RNA-binding Zn ribbon-like protein